MPQHPPNPPLPPIPIAVAYEQAAWDHVKCMEGVVSRIYTDGKGIPTMGAGSALAVLDQGGQWILRSAEAIGAEISGDPQAPYRFTAEEWQLLSLCLEAVAQQRPKQAQALIPPFDPRTETAALNRFGFRLDDTRIRAQTMPKWNAARRVVLADILTAAQARGLSPSLATVYDGSSQDLALTSVRYNIGLGRATPKAIAALLDGDRAALWFEIACNTNPPSNGPSRDGIARRRLVEAELACGAPKLWDPTERSHLRAKLTSIADPFTRSLVPPIGLA